MQRRLIVTTKEKESLKEYIEMELREKGKIVINTEKTDKEVLSALLDICTLNKLRDAQQTC